MAKESASSRIPRLDGVSRIPLPGSLRPPTSNATITKRLTQPQGAPSISAPTFAHKRPTTLAGLRPSLANANVLKRSSSGDHITNAFSMMTKKTASAFKMLISRPEVKPQAPIQKAPPKVQEKPATATPPMGSGGNTLTASTPRPLARSDTFVRTDSPSDVSIIAPHIMAHSTPAPTGAHKSEEGSKGAAANATFKRMPATETTKLLSGKTRPTMYTNVTQSLDGTTKFGETFAARRQDSAPHQTFGLEQTHTLGSDDMEKTLINPKMESPAANSTQILLKPNLMTTFNVISAPGAPKTSHHQTQILKQPSSDNTLVVVDRTKLIDSVDAVSPMTNATYSNPGSMDNLQMLEDVSVPSGFDMDVTLQSETVEGDRSQLDETIMALAPDKAHMKLALNSTVNTERLLDLTANMLSPSNRMNLFNLTKDYTISKSPALDEMKNNTQLLYMTQAHCASASTTPDFGGKYGNGLKQSPLMTMQSPHNLLKGAQSDLVLPTRTPDEEMLGMPMDMDATTLLAMGVRTEEFYASQGKAPQNAGSVAKSLQDVNNPNVKQKSRFSFGLDLTESTLDCSIELVDVSLSSTALSQPNTTSSLLPQSPSSHSQQHLQQTLLKKQNSFELDESLGILTPDQMKEFLDSTNTNNTNNLELPLALGTNNASNNKMSLQQMRIDQTPSPEELPLDPVEVKTDISDIVLQHQQQHQQALFAAQQQRQQMQQQQLQSSSISTEPMSAHTDTDLSKTSDQMSKSNVSKISTSFITSVTSVTSLDTGYQGDGEMSRPASRGASDHSPSNGPMARKGGHVSRQPSFHQQQQQQMPLVRRQDPMTDSDFFTESDADDIFHRGDRRAQVIDGQLYGPMLQQPAASVFISEDPEDSCMESSGIFTDVENRCDEDLAQMRRQDTQDALGDISPEGDADDSTETVKSNRGKCDTTADGSSVEAANALHANAALGQGQLSHSPTTSTMQSSVSTDRLSAATLSNRTSYCSVDGSTVNADCKSFSSLEEAFVECLTAADLKTTQQAATKNTNTNATKRTKNSTTGSGVDRGGGETAGRSCGEEPPSVQRVTPPRKHASLTSLSGASGVYGANKTETKSSLSSSSPLKAGNPTERGTRSETGNGPSDTKVSPSSSTSSLSLGNRSEHHKSVNSSCNSVAGKRTPRGKNSAKTATTIKQRLTNVAHVPPGATTSAGQRKSRTPSKWEAVMNKIESNKALPKRNYDAVKSKVSTTRPQNAVTGSNSRSSASTPLVRRSPSAQGSNAATSPSSAVHSGGPLSPRLTTPLLQQRPTDTGAQAAASGGGGALSSLQAQTTKRLLQGVAAKRGRSYSKDSKDSQKSSQSDLSLASAGGGGGMSSVGGSPKLLAKTPLRAAKKRDVRNLSISPTDLGPPPKAQQTAKGASLLRNKITTTTTTTSILPTQKRFTTTQQANSGSPSSNTAGSRNGAPAGLMIKGRSSPIIRKQPSSLYGHAGGDGNQLQKAPLKEQNRIIGSSQSIAGSTPPPTSNGKTVTSKPGTPTELQELHHNNNNNNKNHLNTTTSAARSIAASTANENGKIAITNTNTTTTTTQPPSTTTTATTIATSQSTRSNSQTPSPILGGGQQGKKLAAIAAGTALLEKKTQSKLQSTRSKAKSIHNQQQQQQQQHLKQQHSIDDASTPISNHSEYLNAAELKRLKHLNRHSCNGRLNYAALERYLEEAELREAQQDKSVEALGVLLQYLVYDLDAFACPAIKKDAAKFEGSLQRTVQLLEDAKGTCTQLQEQLCDKEAYYIQREEELQELHRCEMAKAQANLAEYQAYAQQKQNTLEALIHAKEDEQKRTLDSYRLEMEHKFAQHQQQLTAVEERELELKARLSASQLTEQSLQQQLSQIEKTYATRFQIAGEREIELNERVKALSKELDEMRVTKENSERELRDKLNLTQDEVAVLRLSRKSANDNNSSISERCSSNVSSPRNSSSAAMSSSQEILRLQSEAESLRCVLELKQKEISKLTKQNEELLRDADERAALQAKISLLESRNEMLQSELEIKSEKEKDYQRQIEEIQKAYNHETFKRKRLSYDNEELQWHLKQRSEQLHIVEAKLQELSTCDSHSLASNTTVSSLNRTALQNGADDISPPASPIIKGVIQKHDSVSWVLEMDDETPEVAASKMVKRASSFRSVERSPSTRRQLSVSASAVSSSMNTSINGGAAGDGPNPLSQSMSATSVIRQHSSNATQEFGGSRAHARIRSKSVSVKSSEPSSSRNAKKLLRQTSANSSKKEQQKQEQQQQLELHGWQAPMSSSSPYCGATRPRSSTMAGEAQGVIDEELYRRTATTSAATAGQAPRKLITCDTSTLNSGERLDMHALPTHSSVHDLKVLKKCQEIQESAGEAMVSGTNSEDEGCSASSDEIVCSASTSTGTTGSTSSLNHMKNSHMSLEEEELLLEKINSLNGTPMEVSWSDDVEVFANGATL